jgi:hypothetical protein
MVFFIPWRVVAEESGAAHFGLGTVWSFAAAHESLCGPSRHIVRYADTSGIGG